MAGTIGVGASSRIRAGSVSARRARHRRNAIVIAACWCVVFACMAAVFGMLSGCTEAGVATRQREVQALDQQAAQDQAVADAAADAIAGIVQRYNQAIATGVTDLEAAAEAVRNVATSEAIPDAVAAAVGEAVAEGLPAPEALGAARARLDAALSEITSHRANLARERSALEAEREEARASDEAWFNLSDTFVGGMLAVLVPGGTGAYAVARSLAKKARQAKIDGTRSGVVIGATTVAESVKAGRAADPDFDRWFRLDTPAARVMREVLKSAPDIEAIVKAHKEPRASMPVGGGGVGPIPPTWAPAPKTPA